MKKILSILTLLVFIFSSHAQEENERTNILFLIDASFSMRKNWETKSKWTIAKETVVSVADSLKMSLGDNVYFGIRAYGHQSMPVNSDCFDTQLILPIGNNSRDKIKSVLEGISPKGITPLAFSLEETKKDFEGVKGKNILILITDGAESCQGDPCRIMKILMDNNVVLKPFIIGLDIPIESLEAYNCMGGKVFNERSQENFKAKLQYALNLAIKYATLQVNLLDKSGKATQTDKAMFFYTKKNDALSEIFYHKKDAKGVSDTLYIEPKEYRIEVQTIPKVVSEYFKLDAAKHNIVNIKAPTGTLNMVYVNEQNEAIEIINPLKYGIKIQGAQDYMHQGYLGTKQEYLIGKYDIDLFTLPPTQLYNQEISDGKINTIKIPAPGNLNLKSNLPLYGAVFIKNVDSLINIYSLKPNTTQEILDLQPGEYELVYRMSSEKKMIKTKTIPFTIKSMQTTKIDL